MNTAGKLQAVLTVIAERVTPSEAVWVVGGSAGLLLRGLELEKPPRDLDLYADQEDAAAIHRALFPYAVDVPKRSSTEIYRSMLSHYVIDGVQVELVGEFEVIAHDSTYRTAVREILFPMGLTAGSPPGSYTIVPLAHEFVFNALRDRTDRTRLIADAIKGNKTEHVSAWKLISERNRFSSRFLAQMKSLIGQPETEGYG